MSRERRYADWRPVATRRIPARWIGALVAALFGLSLSVLFHHPSQLVYMGAVALGVYVSNRTANYRLKTLRDEGDDRQFGVTLRLSRETAYGHDEGLVAFEDGYLVYMGRRCVFSLGARDVKVSKVGNDQVEFDFAGPGGKHTAHLQLGKNEDFLEAIRGWRAARRRSQESVLPPVVPDPTWPRSLTVVMNVLTLIVLSAALAAIRSAGIHERGLNLVAAAIALVVALGAASLQFQALGRIARRESRPRSLHRRWRRWRKTQLDKESSVPHPLLESTAVRGDEHNANRLTERA